MRLPYRGSTTSNFHLTSKIAPAFVALAASAALGFGVLSPTHPVSAEPAAGQTLETPAGRAPLSFADVVDKVKPSVVSVSVVNDGGASKVAERTTRMAKKVAALRFPICRLITRCTTSSSTCRRSSGRRKAAVRRSFRDRARASSLHPTDMSSRIIT